MLFNAAKVSGARQTWIYAGIFTAVFGIGPECAAVGIAPPVAGLVPEDGDDFYVFVADQETYDSNLYRLPTSYNVSQIAPNAQRADYVNTASIGGEGQWEIGRQVVDLNLLADENRFAHNNDLNNTSLDGKLLWDWHVGTVFSGQAGADYNRSLASFAETLYLGRDLVSATTYLGNANYQLGPHWSVVGDINQSTYSHDAPGAAYNDFRARSGGVGVVYATDVDDSFEFEYRYLKGIFPQNYLYDGALLNRDYREDTTRLLAKYAFSDKTFVDGYAGYLKREFAQEGVGHFSGDIWRVALHWRATEKTELIASGWHELHAYVVNQSDYFVSRGESLSAVWTASEKLSLSMLVSLEKQGYVATSTSALAFGSRNDKLAAEQINIAYAFKTHLTLNFFVRNEHRTSTDQGFDYGDQLANICIAYKFL